MFSVCTVGTLHTAPAAFQKKSSESQFPKLPSKNEKLAVHKHTYTNWIHKNIELFPSHYSKSFLPSLNLKFFGSVSVVKSFHMIKVQTDLLLRAKSLRAINQVVHLYTPTAQFPLPLSHTR